MTGQKIWEQALALLNYTDSDGRFSSQTSRPVWQRALFLVNQIYRDIWYTRHEESFEELQRLADPVRLPERIASDILPYGVAMLLAQGEGDGDNQAMFSLLYNQKRASLTETDTRQDVLPRPL